MKILDLSFNSYINDDYLLKIYRSIATSNTDLFFDKIDSVSEINSANPIWWAANVSSRNTLSSSLFHNFCLIKLINKVEISDLSYDKIIVDSKVILSLLGSKFPSIKFKLYLKNKNNLLFKVIKSFLLNFLKYFLIKLLSKKITISKNNSLVDIMLYKKNCDYSYYPNLSSYLGDYDYDKLRFVPIFNIYNLFSFINISLSAFKGDNYLFKENYLSIKDIYNSIFFIFNSKYRINVKSNDLFSSLVIEEYKRYSNFSIMNESLQIYYFFNNLNKAQISFKKSINWFENQNHGKIWNFAINKFIGKDITIGFQCIVPVKMYLSQYFITNQEINSGVIPSIIYTVGDFTYNNLKNIPLTVISGPSIRFHHLYDSDQYKISKKILFVALPYMPSETHSILTIVKNLPSHLLTIFDLKIKFHPTYHHSQITKIMKKFNFSKSLIDNNINISNLNNSSFLLTGMSGIAVESIVMKINTILLNFNSNLVFNPIPDILLNNENIFYIEKVSELVKVLQLKINSNHSVNDINLIFNKPNKSLVKEIFV